MKNKFAEGISAAIATRSRRVLPPPPSMTEAAVLIPLFPRNDELYVWIIKRPSAMRRHGDQLAFPGGKRDPEDASPIMTATREAEEEIGLTTAHTRVLGLLDDHMTTTGFVITPVVAWVRAEFVPVLNRAEVERIHAVPLRTFREPGTGQFPRIGHPVGEDFLWGATLAMGRHLLEIFPL